MSSDFKLKGTFLTLVVGTLLSVICVNKVSYVEHKLLPADQTDIVWNINVNTDIDAGGESTMDLRDDTYHLNFDYKLSPKVQYPYASLGLTFETEEDPDRLLDWSHYSTVLLRIKCRPSNVLSFVLHTYEEARTKIADIKSFRPAHDFFSCAEQWSDVEIDLQKLDTADWWLKEQQLNLASQEYSLEQVRGVAVTTTEQSPVLQTSTVDIEALLIKGRNWSLIYSAVLLVVLAWAVFLFFYARRLLATFRLVGTEYTGVEESTPLRDEHSGGEESKPATPYEPVNVESKKSREQISVLEYLAKEYANPEISVATVVNAVGVNRAKINDILRDETGLTFSGYLNKLRLTEAARLLSETEMGVSETAFAVGYGSVSYFNRVFKKYYDCAPSNYKKPENSNSETDSPT